MIRPKMCKLLNCFDAVGWVIWPVKVVPEMTYKVSSGTVSLYTLAINFCIDFEAWFWHLTSPLFTILFYIYMTADVLDRCVHSVDQYCQSGDVCCHPYGGKVSHCLMSVIVGL